MALLVEQQPQLLVDGNPVSYVDVLDYSTAGVGTAWLAAAQSKNENLAIKTKTGITSKGKN